MFRITELMKKFSLMCFKNLYFVNLAFYFAQSLSHRKYLFIYLKLVERSQKYNEYKKLIKTN